MRVTNSMYYDSIYATNNQKLTNELFDVNKQIASGLKIEYASDDVTTFTNTMRLDNELTTLGQVKSSTENGSKVSSQSDAVLNDFTTSLDRTQTLLLQAANGAQSDTSLDAIANELRGLEDHFKNLANTSINGQYIFSGSATGTKPIAADGTYQGNDQALNAITGSNTSQQYNLSGAELFLGEESGQKREITSNTVNRNLFDDSALSSSDSIRDLMGDKDNDTDTVNTNYFYLRGTQSDGTAIKEKIALDDTESIDTLLERIGTAYGNTTDNQVVNVSMNPSGEIVVEDKLSGSSKLDFHMVAAVDYSGGDSANVDNIDDLDDGETKYPPDGDLYVKEILRSDLTPADGAATNIQGLVYDRTQFEKDGFKLSSNAPQIEKDGNAFASPSTKISEVADLSQTNAGTLDGSSLKLTGVNVEGDSYDATINFKSSDNGGSTFTIGGTDYKIYDMGDPRAAVNADDMTYQQLMDVVNMVTTNTLPDDDSAEKYDEAIQTSNYKGKTSLSYDGRIEFQDISGNNSDGTAASISIYDPNSNDFSDGAQASIMTFNANDSLTVRDPKTDFFKSLDEAISAVEQHKTYPDAGSGDARNVGIENSIQMITDLSDHIYRSQSKVGAQSNALDNSLERTTLLETSTISLRSDVIDTDLAEASLRLTQLDNDYQAMLSTVGKVSQLSLVNYL